MMWTDVGALLLRQEGDGRDVVDAGVLLEISETTPTALVEADDGARFVGHPWQDRVRFMAEFVRTCTAFRVRVFVFSGNVVRCVVQVDPARFQDTMLSAGAQEFQAAMFLSHVAPRMVPCDLVPCTRPGPPRADKGHWAVPLRPHQSVSRDWIVDTERMLQERVAVRSSLAIPGTEWHLHTHSHAFQETPTHQHRAFRGAVLADDVGTGKTATMLRALCALRAPSVAPSTQSRGTLVLVPSNLPSQWLHEIQVFTEGTLRVVTLLSAKDVKTLTRADLLTADIVLSSIPYLRSSTSYQSVLERSMVRLTSNRRHCRSKACLRTWARTAEPDDPAIVESVTWSRVVVDEMHEVLESSKDLRFLQTLSYRFLWGMTATPCMCASAVWKYCDLFCEEDVSGPTATMDMFRMLVHGHGSDLKHGRTLCRVPTELAESRLIRANGNSIADIILLCTNLFSRHLLPDITMHDRNTICAAVRGSLPASIDALAADVERLDREIASMSAGMLMESNELARQGVERLVRRRNEHARRIVENRSRLEFIDGRLAQVDSEVCCVCFVARTNVITQCGHLFCDGCVLTVLRSERTRCPLCRTELKPDAVHGFTSAGFGSRFNAIAEFIASIDRAREPILVVAQWKELVKHVRATLRSRMIPSARLCGTMLQRARTLRAFAMNGGVLVLCTKDSFAGLDLPTVHHIIFAHALVGEASRVSSLERQIIARAARGGNRGVCVSFYVFANTHEEVLWYRSHM